MARNAALSRLDEKGPCAVTWRLDKVTGRATLDCGPYLTLLAEKWRYYVRIGATQLTGECGDLEHAKIRAVEVASDALRPAFVALKKIKSGEGN